MRPVHQLSIDIATFLNRYQDLVTVEPGVPYMEADPAPAHMVFPQSFRNLARAESYGLEASVAWIVSEEWSWGLGYTGLKMHLHYDAASQDEYAERMVGKTPSHQFHVQSDIRFRPNLRLNAAVSYVDGLHTFGLPSRFRADLNLGWRLTDALDLTVAAKNLLDDSHLEFGQTEDLTQATLVQRSVYGKLTWVF